MGIRATLRRFADRLLGPPPSGEAAGIGSDDKFLAVYGGDNAVLENPDLLLADCPERNHETIYDLYEEMRRKDGHLDAMVRKRQTELLKRSWRIEPASERLRDRKLAAWVDGQFRAVRGFNQDLRELLDAIPMGMAVSEILWEADGAEIRIARLHARRQRRFAFSVDGRLLLKRHSYDLAGEPVPDRKFLHHVHEPAYESPFGTALLGRAVWPYWFKRNGVRFWALFNEKRAFPPAVAKFQPGTPPTDLATLDAVLKTIQTETGIRIPNTVEIDFLELASHVPIRTYKEFIDLMDTWETKILLHETLTTGEGKPGHLSGSGPSDAHGATADALAASDGKALSATLDTLIEWLVDFNVPGVTDYPRLLFNTEPSEDLQAKAEIDKKLLVDGGLAAHVAGKYWFDTYGWPQASDAEPALALAAPTSPAQPPEAPPFADPEAARLFRSAHDDTNRLLSLIARDIAHRHGG